LAKEEKKLSNALKSLDIPEVLKSHAFMDKRAEELSVEDFINFTQEWKAAKN
jgi:16S rRNA (adenine1518-N6/adenine1519-N6)-dimethyltransferase